MMQKVLKPANLMLAVSLVILVAVSASYLISSVIQYYTPLVYEGDEVKPFSSRQEFRSYLQKVAPLSLQSNYVNLGRVSVALPVAELRAETAGDMTLTDGYAPSRVSGTNVQVAGIDEPDIVKTDGSEIYFSSEGRYVWNEGGEQYRYYSGETKVVSAFPPADMNLSAKMDARGDLLLYGDVLVILSGHEIYGYDVSDPASPEEIWKMELNDNLVGARLYNGKIYLVTMDWIDQYRPCPLMPVARAEKTGVSTPVVIDCTRIYHPARPVDVDITYNAMVMDPSSGDVEKSVSFLGSYDSSVLYMSENAIYITYSYSGDILGLMVDFFRESADDIIPSEIIERIEAINSYDISMASKMTEFTLTLQKYFNSLDGDERLRIENEISNRLADYLKEHKREILKTGIVKIGLDMEISGSGSVPGTPLNQFSLDEYEGHLRIAVTVSGQMGLLGSAGESANDVYVLDGGLEIKGSVKDLGLTERIYSVRFLQDKGYVVTFRETDPFYVLDMSDPENPELKGELKIPGYSSYLHPLGEDNILGIGKEESNVKISLFDVSSAENPTEKDKYTLKEYWSDILNTHHAFLLDPKHEVFFLPGSSSGYVFSYKDAKLSLVKALSDISATRAVYIDDYLYIIGNDKITVLDENTWESAGEIEFSSRHDV